MFDLQIKKILVDAAEITKSSWAIVRDGVVAEFSVVLGDKPIKTFENNTLKIDTHRATLCVNFDESVKAVVAESGAHGCSPWTQHVYLCIQKDQAKMSCRNKLTYLGKFDNGVDKGDLWDLGVGNQTLDACIIAKDESTNDLLKQKEGQYIIDDPNFLRELVIHSPPRLFQTKFAYILVRQKIPLTEKEELEGPHTHLLPPIIKSKKHFEVPVPEDMVPIIQTDPFGSVIDGNGDFHAWNGFENDSFQMFLQKYGSPQYVTLKNEIKQKIIGCLSNRDFSTIEVEYKDKTKQDLIRITLAQIVCNDKLDITIRQEAYRLLENLKTINLRGLKQWIQNMAPEIQN